MLKYPKAVWLLIIGMLLNMVGSSFLWPFNTIYIHDILGKSLATAGFALMLNSGAGIIGNMAGGYFFDKLGGFKTIVTGIGITVASALGLLFIHDWPYYAIFLTIMGFGSGMVFPAMYALIGTVWKEGGRRGFNALYVTQNLGVAVGTALGGIVAGGNMNNIFLANTVLYVAFFGLVLFGYRSFANNEIRVDIEKTKKVKEKFVMTPSLRALLLVCIAYGLCWFAYVQWQGPIATHIQSFDVSVQQYSVLWTVNGALIVLAQPIVSRILTATHLTIKKQIIVGIGIMASSFVLISTVEMFKWFLAGMVILTIGEMFVYPAIPTIANMLAPKDKVGMYQGIVNSAATGGRMFAPFLGGLITDKLGINALFIVVVVVLLVGIVIATIYDRGLKSKHKKHSVAA
ncbi:MAG: MDR family MFS transporter [Bacillaceae bacterium]